MNEARLAAALAERGQPAYRVRQAIEARRAGARSWDDVTSWPQALRQEIAAVLPLWSLTPESEASSRDGTVKWVLRAGDGSRVEAVSIAHARGRRTVCVSSQVGCALGCSFCATGRMGAGRDLTAQEIVDQVTYAGVVAEQADARVSNVVFMGMGEPMMNLEAVLAACRHICDPNEIGISARKVAISTAGWVPGIAALAEQPLPLRLAISLHAADDETRDVLMPINKRWPIANLMAACRRYTATTRRRVFVEYLLLDGVNDSQEDANRLAGLVRDGDFHINLIQYNATDGGYRASRPERRERFVIALERAGVSPSVRRSRGADIDAACGQLALKA